MGGHHVPLQLPRGLHEQQRKSDGLRRQAVRRVQRLGVRRQRGRVLPLGDRHLRRGGRQHRAVLFRVRELRHALEPAAGQRRAEVPFSGPDRARRQGRPLRREMQSGGLSGLQRYHQHLFRRLHGHRRRAAVHRVPARRRQLCVRRRVRRRPLQHVLRGVRAVQHIAVSRVDVPSALPRAVVDPRRGMPAVRQRVAAEPRRAVCARKHRRPERGAAGAGGARKRREGPHCAPVDQRRRPLAFAAVAGCDGRGEPAPLPVRRRVHQQLRVGERDVGALALPSLIIWRSFGRGRRDPRALLPAVRVSGPPQRVGGV